MIDILSRMRGGYKNGVWDPNLKPADFGATSLTLITPDNTMIDDDLIKYATGKGVSLRQRKVEQSTSDETVIRVQSGVIMHNMPTGVTGSLPNPTTTIRRHGRKSFFNWLKL